jgi:hypothetical protein
MYILPTVQDLSIEGVYDRGVPNSERILLKAERPVQLAEFILCLGVSTPAGGYWLLNDHLFWFGDESWIHPPFWIFVYTGRGERRMTHLPQGGQPALVLHWGRSTTVLDNPVVTPLIIRMGGILFPRQRLPLDPSSSTKVGGPPTPRAGGPPTPPHNTSTLLTELLKQLGEPKK